MTIRRKTVLFLCILFLCPLFIYAKNLDNPIETGLDYAQNALSNLSVKVDLPEVHPSPISELSKKLSLEKLGVEVRAVLTGADHFGQKVIEKTNLWASMALSFRRHSVAVPVVASEISQGVSKDEF